MRIGAAAVVASTRGTSGMESLPARKLKTIADGISMIGSKQRW
jgi:hypothetical protein